MISFGYSSHSSLGFRQNYQSNSIKFGNLNKINEIVATSKKTYDACRVQREIDQLCEFHSNPQFKEAAANALRVIRDYFKSPQCHMGTPECVSDHLEDSLKEYGIKL